MLITAYFKMLIFRISVIASLLLALPISTVAKVYRKCELAKELSEVHGIPWQDVATYVCLAERQSNFNTQAVGEGLYYGMYQMSSEFWCDHNYAGKACNVRCSSLLDDDLSDDLRCMRTIIDEHQRLSGNGFNAWPSGRQCQSMGVNYIADCSQPESNQVHSTYSGNSNNNNNYKKVTPQQKKTSGNVGRGKVYERCELALELRDRHNIQRDHISTWVCIAKHESNFNTSAIGRLNWDGSEDHGLFQISDIYWCGDDGGKGCGLSCDDLEDNDISNDIECIKTIHAEHTRLFGDGFQAWAVYPRCKGQSESYISGCFDDADNEVIPAVKPHPGVQQPSKPKISHHRHSPSSSSAETEKVYDRCELALELRDRHNLPINQIATWVCIAKHESNFNTSAIGRLNWDGSEDHGLFQISDIYWCGGADGKGCGLSCDDLKDNDISNDIECIKTIHAEHTRLFGDGFQAWAVYPRCKGQSESYIKGCFDDASNEIVPFKPKPGVQQPHVTYTKTTGLRKDYNKAAAGKGKVYERCELAQELRFKHKIPMEEVATWVCIAKHESNFNTSAIGRLNWDGSEDHGLFQISDLYWCTKQGQGKGCNLACDDLEDSDITDDVECMLKIHAEHTFLSGNGFNAWAVFKPHCQGRAKSYIDGCFNEDEDNFIHNIRPAVTQPTKSTRTSTTTTPKMTTTKKKTTTQTPKKTTTTRWYHQFKTTPPEEVFDTTTLYETTTKATSREHPKPLFVGFTTQQNNVNKHSSLSTATMATTIGSKMSKVAGKLNEQSASVADTTTTTKSYRVPSSSIATSSTSTAAKSSFAKSTSNNHVKSSTTSKPQATKTTAPAVSAERKAVTPFDVFSFYLRDFTSKAPQAQYKPIQFSDKSTVIFKKSDTSAPSSSSTSWHATTTTRSTKSTSTLNAEKYVDAQTTPSPKLPLFPPYYTASIGKNSFDHNRIGRVGGNITPHSFDYLLKLTTPRTFYG